MTKPLVILFFIFQILAFETYAQSLDLVKSINLGFEVVNGSIDRQGNLYLSSEDGSVFKYDYKGDSLLAYSSIKSSRITLLEAWSGLKIFLFYEDFQEYLLLDRFLVPSPFYSFPPELIEYAGMATFSNDENIWVLDPINFSLKKYNPFSNSVEVSTKLDLIISLEDHDITFMKEHQNLLFINDRNSGIHILDNFGNYQNKLDIPGLNFFNFWKNNLYYFKEGKIILFNIYNGKIEEIKIPVDLDPQLVLLGENQVYILETSLLHIFLKK